MTDLKAKVGEIIKKGSESSHIERSQNNTPIIDDRAKMLVDKVFNQLKSIFPAWRHAWPDADSINSAKKEWVKAFIENEVNTITQLQRGFKKARASDSSFLPSVGKFISWCKLSLDDFDVGTPEQITNKVVSYHHSKEFISGKAEENPFIIAVEKSLDWFAFKAMKQEQAIKEVERVSMELLKNGYNPESVQTMQEAPRLEQEAKPETEKARPEKVAENIQILRNKLKGKGNE